MAATARAAAVAFAVTGGACLDEEEAIAPASVEAELASRPEASSDDADEAFAFDDEDELTTQGGNSRDRFLCGGVICGPHQGVCCNDRCRPLPTRPGFRCIERPGDGRTE